MFSDILPWAIFVALVTGMLALDLGVFHRGAHEVRRKEALLWSVAWISLALVFNAGVYAFMGADSGLEWTTGYLIEKSLSVDNVFVFLIIFAAFAVPPAYQHRVLFWGIIGAIVLRAILIALAGVLISTLHFVIYIFGAFLIITGIRFLRKDESEPDLEKSPVIRLVRKLFPVTQGYEGHRFFVRANGLLMATPLFLVLLLVESSDLVFAVDSIPAIYAITEDPFIVFTSNIFAILGLRSLYFVIAGYLGELRFLRPALAAILMVVGTKMLIADVYKLDPLISLVIVLMILTAAVLASIRWPLPKSEVDPHLGRADPLPDRP